LIVGGYCWVNRLTSRHSKRDGAVPARGLAWPILDLLALALLVRSGMLISLFLAAPRLARLRVVETLREL